MSAMMKMKATALLSIASVFLLALAACGPSAQPAQSTGEAPKEQSASGEEARYKVELAKERGGSPSPGSPSGTPTTPIW